MRELPVLHITENSASWLARGQEAQLLRAHIDAPEGTMAQAIARVLKENGERREPCILALDQVHYQRRQIDLPANISGKELRDVLHRKATNLLKTDGKVRFQALPLCGTRKKKKEGSQTWLLFAIETPKLQGMIEDLLHVGINVDRVVAAELAYQGQIESGELGEMHAAIQVGQLQDAIGVSLICDAGLVSQNIIPTHSLDAGTIASTLVQELRSVDSYWRKLSEGGVVTRAHFNGFGTVCSDAITPATQMVLPEIELSFEDADTEPDDTDHAMLAMMKACRSMGPLAIDFTFAIPPRRRVSVLMAVASLAVIFSVGNWGRDTLASKSASARRDMVAYRLPAELSESSAILQAEIATLNQIESNFESEWAAFTGTSDSGLPYSVICAELMRAFQNDAVLESLSIFEQGYGTEYEVVGVTQADTKHAAHALEATRSRLARAGRFGAFELVPDTRVPTQDDQTQLLRFTIKGTWTQSKAGGSK